MRLTVFVRERDGGQRAAAKADLRGLPVPSQRIRAVAADLLLVNQLDRGSRLEPVKIMAIRERVLQRFDNWLWYPVLCGGALEVVLDCKRHLYWANVVLDGPDGGLEHARA